MADPAVPSAGEDEPAEVQPERVRARNLRDLAMLALGVASLGLIVYDFVSAATLTPAQTRTLHLVDLAIVVVFAAEFLWRWREHGWKAGFAVRNWFDVLGMVPMMATNLPLFRAFRLVRLGVVASRLLRMWAYVTGHQSAQTVFNRYRAALVEEVSDRVMLNTLRMVEDVAARGGYVRALGDTLEARGEDLAAAVLKGAREGGTGRFLGLVPGGEAALRGAVHAAVTSVVAALRSEEMQRTFEASVRGLLDESRRELQRKSWREDHAPTGPSLLRRRDPAGDAA